MIKHWPLPQRKIVALSGAIFTAVLLAAFNGIVGKYAGIFFDILYHVIITSFNVDPGAWLVIIVIFLVCIVLIFIWRIDRKHLTSNMNVMIDGFNTTLTTEIGNLRLKLDGNNQWFELTDSLMRLLPSLIESVDINDEMHRFIKRILSSSTHLFSKVYGSSLFLLDSQNKEVLTIWEYYQTPADSAARAKCYIGPARPGEKRGVAGEAYVKRSIIIAHMTQEKDDHGQWKFDKDSYIPFTEEGTYPAFNSFACAPIIVGTGPNDCLGVVCVDSTDFSAFDTKDVQEILIRLGRYIGAALLIYNALQNARGPDLSVNATGVK
jgi:hypothetical protein